MKFQKTYLKCTIYLLVSLFLIQISLACVTPEDGMNIYKDTVLCPGTYHLETGITMSNDSKSLTCQNTTLIGNGTPSHGINVYTRENTEINGCNIQNFINGIEIHGYYDFSHSIHYPSSFNHIHNNTLKNNQRGIYINGIVKNNIIKDNTLINNSYEISGVDFGTGIYVNSNIRPKELGNNLIINNTVHDGILTKNINGDEFCKNGNQNNYIGGSKGPNCSGIYPFPEMKISSDENIIPGTYRFDNSWSYIISLRETGTILDCQDVELIGNDFGTGIFVEKSAEDSKIKNCTIKNFNSGIKLDSSNEMQYRAQGTQISDSTLQNNSKGIEITSVSYNNTIKDNVIKGNYYNSFGSGVHISSSKWFNELGHNTVINNTFYDGLFTDGYNADNYCINNNSNTYLNGSLGPDCDGIYPYPDMYIYSNTTLKPGTFNYDTFSNVLTFGEHRITLDCNGAILNNTGHGTAFDLNENNFNTIKNCSFRNFYWGVDSQSTSYTKIENNYGLNSYTGIDGTFMRDSIISNTGIFQSEECNYELDRTNNITLTNINPLKVCSDENLTWNGTICTEKDVSISELEYSLNNKTAAINIRIQNNDYYNANNTDLKVYKLNLRNKTQKLIFNKTYTPLQGKDSLNLNITTTITDNTQILAFLDTNNIIQETNEDNNFASVDIMLTNTSNKSIHHKPVILHLTPEYKGTFISHENIVVQNKITALVSDFDNDIDRVEFKVENKTYIDNQGDDGWSHEIPVNFTESTDVKVKAYDTKNQSSVQKRLTINVIGYANLPNWIINVNNPLKAKVNFSNGNFYVGAGLNPPINKSLDLPDNMPVIGGENYVKADFQVGVLYNMHNKKIKFYGDGYAQGKVFKRDAYAQMGLNGSLKANSLKNIVFLGGQAYLFLEVEALKYPFTYNIPYLDEEIGITLTGTPKLYLEGSFNSEFSLSELETRLAAEVNAKAEMGNSDFLIPVNVALEATAELSITTNYHPIEKDFSMYSTVYGELGAAWQFGLWKKSYSIASSYTFPKQNQTEAENYHRKPVTYSPEEEIQSFSTLSIDNTKLTDNIYQDFRPDITEMNKTILTAYSSIHDDIYSTKNEEIYVSTLKNTWQSTQITHNNNWDFDPVLTSTKNTTYLSWVSSTNTTERTYEMFMDSIKNHEIKLKEYKQSKWGSTILVTNDSYPDGKVDILAKDNLLYMAWIKDMDKDITTFNDTELYFAIYNKTNNDITKKRITNDTTADHTPNLIYNQKPMIVWRKETSTGEDTEIFYTNISTIYQLTNNTVPEKTISTSSNSISWVQNSSKVMYSKYNGMEWLSEEVTEKNSTIQAISLQSTLNHSTIIWRNLNASQPKGELFSTSKLKSRHWSIPRKLTNNNLTDWKISTSGKQNISMAWMQKSDFENDIRYKKVTLKPELSVLSIDYTPQTRNITITTRLINKGEKDSRNISLTYTTNNGLNEERQINLNYSEIKISKLNFSLNNNSTNLTVCLDKQNNIQEHNETNNCKSKMIEFLPELNIQNISLNNTINGSNSTLSFFVNNSGRIKEYEIWTKQNNEIINKRNLTVKSETLVNISTIIHNNNTFKILIDPKNRIRDYNESNNNYTYNFHPKADISPLMPQLNFSDNILKINATIQNKGTLTANTTIQIYDGDPILENSTLIRNITVIIQPKDNRYININYKPKDSGQRYIFVKSCNKDMNQTNNLNYNTLNVNLKPDTRINQVNLDYHNNTLYYDAIIENIGKTTSNLKLCLYENSTQLDCKFIPLIGNQETKNIRNNLSMPAEQHTLLFKLINYSGTDINLTNNEYNIEGTIDNNVTRFGDMPSSFEITEDTNLITELNITYSNNLTLTTSNNYSTNNKTLIYLPQKDWQGTETIELTALSRGITANKIINITVLPVNDKPVINSTPKATATEGSLYNYTIDAIDVDSSLNYTCNNSQFLQVGNTFYFQPTQKDADKSPITVNFTVSDGENKVSQISTINIAETNSAPVIKAKSNFIVHENTTLNISANITDEESDILNISYGKYIRNGTWKPSFNQSEVYSFTISADDGEFITKKNITVRVLESNRLPTISNLTNLTVREGKDIVINPTFEDPDNDVFMETYSQPINSLGKWLTKEGDKGSYKINITANDGEVNTTRSIYITVKPKIYSKVKQFTQGLNLISIPYNNSNLTTAKDILDEISNSTFLAKYNKTTNSYNTYTKGVPIGNFNIDYDKAYFLKTSGTTNYNFSGTFISQKTIPLSEGLNLRSYLNETNSSAETVCSRYNQASFISVHKSGTNGFRSHVCGYNHENFELSKGDGYFIRRVIK